jgi:predicted Fe-Mo cluster-binding NifX family protein
MKVAITVTNSTGSPILEPRFGRAPFFLIIDTESNEMAYIENPATEENHGAGVMAAQTLSDTGVTLVVSGKYGPNGYRALHQMGIDCFVFNNLSTIEDIRQAITAQTLKPFDA